MNRGLGVVGLLSVAACGTLAGHAVTYLLEARSMDDGRHGYFTPAVEIAVATALFFAVITVVRILSAAPGRRACDSPPLLSLCVTLATLQVAGFATMEFLEGNPPDPIGCGVEILTALLIAVVVSLALAFVERCVAPMMTYLRRSSGVNRVVRRPPIAFVRPPLLLAVCTGVRRFKRPPPLFG